MPNPRPGAGPVPFHASPAQAAGTVPTADDIRRQFYDTAPYSAWVTEIQLDPLALIVMDDATGQLTRVPVTTGPGGQVTFGTPVPVLVDYVTDPNPPGQAPAAASAAYPPGRKVAGSWPSRAAARAGIPAPGVRSLRLSPGQREQIIAGVVATGRIPAAKADRYRAELDAGGTRAGTAVHQLAMMWPAGQPIGAASPASVAAAKSGDEAVYSALFGDAKTPVPSDARHGAPPLNITEYRRLYPEDPVSRLNEPGPPLPDLAGWIPDVQMTTPAEVPGGPQFDLASAGVRAAPAMQTPGQLGIVEHGEIEGGAWHEHAHGHPGSDANGHSHQHVHQPGSGGSHAIGPGHSHDGAVEYVPDLASARPRTGGRPPVLAVTRALAAASASPSVRVTWPAPPDPPPGAQVAASARRWAAGPPGRAPGP